MPQLLPWCLRMTDCDVEVEARLVLVMVSITASESELGQHVISSAKVTDRVEWTFDMQEAEVLCGHSHASHLPVS